MTVLPPDRWSAASRWLLDPVDPAVRARALVTLDGRPEDDEMVRSEWTQAFVRGSVARIANGLIAARKPDELWFPKYGAPYHRLVALAEMEVPTGDSRIERTLDACLDTFANPDGGFSRPGRTESHLCITGNLTRAGLHFGRGNDVRIRRGVQWLLSRQRADGGWHCFPEDEPGSILDSWEPLAALGKIPIHQRSASVAESISRGVEFLLSQHLGAKADYEPWRRIHFPRHYYYDFLLGLELATTLGDPRDWRLSPALDLLEQKRDGDGKWRLDQTHPDVDPEGDPPYKPVYAEMMRTTVRLEVEPPGAPSRWATLRAIETLRRAGRGAT